MKVFNVFIGFVYIAGVVGWIINLIDLINYGGFWRLAGVIVAPLGSVLGLFF